MSKSFCETRERATGNLQVNPLAPLHGHRVWHHPAPKFPAPLLCALWLAFILLSGCTHPDEPNPLRYWQHRQFFQGMEQVNAGSYVQAIDTFDAYLNRHAGDNASYYFRGQAKYFTGDFAGALQDFEQALRLYPEGDEHYLTRTWRGMARSALGEYEGALADFDESLRTYAEDSARAWAYLGRGRTQHALREYEAAIHDYEQAIRLDADLAWLGYWGRGNARYCLRQLAAAIADFDAALRLNPNDAFIFYKRGTAWYGLGQYGKALADYDTALNLDTELGTAFHARGLVQHSRGHMEEAIEDYNATLLWTSKEEVLLHTYYRRGNAWYALGNFAAAAADYEEVLRRNPECPSAYYARGNARYMLGLREEAKADYAMYHRLIPASALQAQALYSGFQRQDGELPLTTDDLVQNPVYFQVCQSRRMA